MTSTKIYDAIHGVQQAFLALLQLCEADEVDEEALRLEMLDILKEKLRLVLNTFTESKRFKILLDELCNATAVPAASDHAAARLHVCELCCDVYRVVEQVVL